MVSLSYLLILVALLKDGKETIASPLSTETSEMILSYVEPMKPLNREFVMDNGGKVDDRPPVYSVQMPIPEFQTVDRNKQTINQYWTAFEKKRMTSLLHCEAMLLKKTQEALEADKVVVLNNQPQDVVVDIVRRTSPSHPNDPFTLTVPIIQPMEPAPLTVLVPEYTSPMFEGQARVKDIEVSLDRCYREMRALETEHDPDAEKRQTLIREMGLIMDQIEACTSAGGQATSLDDTMASQGRVRKQDGPQAAALSNVQIVLKSSIIQLDVERDACFKTLDLPEDMLHLLDLNKGQ